MQAAANRRNNFDAIRLAAALAVLWDHQHALMGLPGPKALHNSYGGLAVAVFFAISGYLVAKSWLNDPHLLRFAWRRALRIWPGLIVTVLLSVFVLGPIATQLPAADYLRHPQTWAYLKTLYLDVQFDLPGVFADNLSHSVNGSLWTIPIEVKCYIALAALGMFGPWKYPVSSLIFLAGLIAYSTIRHMTSANADQARSYSLQYAVVFAIGMVFAHAERFWIQQPWRAVLASVLVVTALAWTTLPVWLGQAPIWALGCAAIVIGASSWPVLRDVGRFGDCSYGAYIYAFPVQQCVLWLLGPGFSHFWLATGLSLVLTLLLAWASWHLIEQPALRLKPRNPSSTRPAQS